MHMSGVQAMNCNVISTVMAIAAAGAIVKARRQADIFVAGLGSGFVKALRVDICPKRGNSTNATAHVHHKIPDASVFEEGATIRGRPRI
jgi:hypothetical protein